MTLLHKYIDKIKSTSMLINLFVLSSFVFFFTVVSILFVQNVTITKPLLTVTKTENSGEYAQINETEIDTLEHFFVTDIEPAAGESVDNSNEILDEELPSFDPPEQSVLNLETVLVPQKSTIISSSRDGKIIKINYDNGDLFEAGDILIEYDCRDIKAELSARQSEEDLSRRKALRSMKLLKLEIISDIENLTLNTEQKRAEAQKKALQQRIDSCYIKADYNGRVTNRLANSGEYTRTDRVLMEVSSLDTMEADFLMPSRALRWANIGAEVSIELYETGRIYTAKIVRFHGEVDPASQSIQTTVKLDAYEDRLLPGMSGTLILDLNKIQEQGIMGFLTLPRTDMKDH